MKTVINNILNILSENSISVYSLAKTSGINQSTLHKILHFERTMKPKHFYNIVDNLPISLSDKNILTNRYRKLLLGSERYNTQHYILNMLKNFSNDSFSPISSLLTPPSVTHNAQETIAIYKGSAMSAYISIALIEEMNRQNPKAYIYIPGTCSEIWSYIDNTAKLYKTNINITFMIDFINNTTKSKVNLNLKIMQNIMPIALSASANYNFYYTYVDAVANDSYMTPYPYFIVTSNKTIWLNNSSDEIMVITDENVTKNLLTYCDGKLTKYKRLLDINSNVHSIVNTLVSNQNNATEHYCIEYEPCLSLYFTKDMIEAVVPKDISSREQLIQILNIRLTQLKKIKSSIQIFNKNSIMDFAKTGLITEFPSKYSRPCTVDERRYILNCLIDAASSDKHIIRALNPINLQISDCLSLIIQDESCMQFSVWNDKKIPLKYLTITESTISKCFMNFIKDIPESNLVFDKSQTIDFINEALAYIDTL